jgi:hypothetical protein
MKLADEIKVMAGGPGSGPRPGGGAGLKAAPGHAQEAIKMARYNLLYNGTKFDKESAKGARTYTGQLPRGNKSSSSPPVSSPETHDLAIRDGNDGWKHTVTDGTGNVTHSAAGKNAHLSDYLHNNFSLNQQSGEKQFKVKPVAPGKER